MPNETEFETNSLLKKSYLFKAVRYLMFLLLYVTNANNFIQFSLLRGSEKYFNTIFYG